MVKILSINISNHHNVLKTMYNGCCKCHTSTFYHPHCTTHMTDLTHYNPPFKHLSLHTSIISYCCSLDSFKIIDGESTIQNFTHMVSFTNPPRLFTTIQLL